ncbi:MAG: LarC family nickel insertion protein [Casimicrobiaceae bacterium]
MSFPSSADAAALPPPSALTIHLDLVGGISGDMFIAAMVDALPALAAPVLGALAAVRPVGAPAAIFEETSTGGLRARRFGVAAPTSGAAYRAAVAERAGANAGVAWHAGTAYSALREGLDRAPLSAPTRRHALALLALLAEAEARVHGIPIAEVHFHELGDWDSLLDIVAAGCIAAQLEGAQWSASAPPLGAGTVRTAHGLLPVPAPATSLLLTGYPWHDDGIAGERVTPTGAAILRHLVPAAACAARRDAGRLLCVGSGAGTRSLPGLPNMVRVMVSERSAQSNRDADGDIVAILDFEIDDMTGEEIALAADRLRAETGVLDLSIGARQGKKGRQLADFRLLALPQAAAAIAQACFIETTTLGLRLREEQRRILRRAEFVTTVDTATVRVKISERPGGKLTAKAAHDDVASTRGLGARRKTRVTATRRALKGGVK